MLTKRIQELKQSIIEYAALVESMIDKSVRAMTARDGKTLQAIIEIEEPKANDFDLRMDEACINAIAQYQPRARDLRTIIMILKMSNDLERLGDGAVHICKDALYLIERPAFRPIPAMNRLAQESLGMLKDSIDAFINEDAESARGICGRDDVVDDLRDKIVADLTQSMGEQPATVPIALRLMDISRKLERAADLSTNLCEDIIFMVQGRVIKHHKGE
ncbi:MAG: phosphate signaling complex protein PhoU [Candidatus Neomarinimicrobiota bacterium]